MPRRNSVNRNEVMDMLRREGMYIIETRDDVNKMLDVMARFYADDGRYKDISAFCFMTEHIGVS